MQIKRSNPTPSRISATQSRVRTAGDSSFGSHINAAHRANVLRSFGISAVGASELVRGAPVSSAADRLMIENVVRQPRSLGNFEIQQLMSAYNQSETLASNVMKKKDDADDDNSNKIG